MSRGSARRARVPGPRSAFALRSPKLVALVCLAALACAGPPAPIEVMPSGEPLALDDARVRATLDAYQRQGASRRGLQGRARVALDGPDFKLSRPQRIAVERPDRLRFEILAPFDQIAAILATDGEHFDFVDAGVGEVQRGRVTPTLLWDLTKIDLDPEELVGLLLAAPEPAPGTRLAGAWIDPMGDLALAFAWSTAGSDAFVAEGGQVLVFDAGGVLVVVRAVEPGGGLRYRARFEEHGALDASGVVGAPSVAGEDARGVIFPKRVTLESPGIGASARFVWTRVLLADELPDQLFRLPAPIGAR